MKESLLIVEDEFIVANDLRMMLVDAGYHVSGIAATVDAAIHLIDTQKPTWVLLDIFLQEGSMGTDLAHYLSEKDIGFIYISANTNQSVLDIARATHPYGFLVKPFREKDLLIMLDIARTRHQQNLHFAAQREFILKQQLQYLIEATDGYDAMLARVGSAFQSVIPFDLLKINFAEPGEGPENERYFFRAGFDEYQVLRYKDFCTQLKLSNYDKALYGEQSQLPVANDTFNGEQYQKHLDNNHWDQKISWQYQLQSMAVFSVENNGQKVTLSFYSKKPDTYNGQHLALLAKTGKTILEIGSPLNEAPTARQPMRRAARINAPIDEKNNKFPGIIGKSAALLKVLDSVEMVADTPVTVLILGESGTGKERVAKTIHDLSARKGQPFITINCAALPSELIESELFGHEKGAFTGASDKRAGKFELANGGTLFLDEIGELPLESQVKLLRVLQEKEFEPLGSNKTIKVDVRIVAATNRNLENAVSKHLFRLDLYYRLNVYPVELPPLRERKEDIPLLANYFLRKIAGLMVRNDIPVLTVRAVKQLEEYNWPGNIRELEHLMERAFIRSRGGAIDDLQLPTANPDVPLNSNNPNGASKTLEEMEVAHILAVLKKCNGKVFGAGGAAEALGLRPSTLTSRMKKLGIKKELYHGR